MPSLVTKKRNMPLPTSFIPEPDTPAKRIIRTPEEDTAADVGRAPTPEPPTPEAPTSDVGTALPPTLEVVVEDIVVPTESMEKRYTLKELRVMCSERNLSDKGNKSDLVQRLETA